MSKLQKLLLPTVLGLLFALPGCSQVPLTGRKQLNLVPDSLMNTMSFQSYGEFLAENKLSDNLEQTQMVRRVGRRIQQAVEDYSAQKDISLKGYAWEFNLIEDEAVNAWAMPGGKVVVYTGLLPVAQDDPGLAVVMGHEIAHAIAKHGGERMSHGLIVEMGGMALSQALAKQPAATRNLFLKSYGVGTQTAVLLPYSRTQEKEADRMGLVFMAMAGYDPHTALDFWRRMAAARKTAAPPEFLSTHPADDTRISNIETFMSEAMRHYRPAAQP